jgi:hypothetical protein
VFSCPEKNIERRHADLGVGFDMEAERGAPIDLGLAESRVASRLVGELHAGLQRR